MQLPYDELKSRLSTPAGIDSLYRDSVEESEFIDFKEPPRDASGPYGIFAKSGSGISRRGRYDFGKDVTAFANHLGGFILIGVSENRHLHCAERVVPVNDAGKVADKLNQWLMDGLIIPRPLGSHAWSLENGIVIVEVRRRAAGVVHGFWTGHELKYYARVGRQNVEIFHHEVEQLRGRSPEEGTSQELPPLLERLVRTVPDLLTASRVPLGLGAAVEAYIGETTSAFAIYLAALSTDVLDGMFARAIKHVTAKGKKYDRWADMFCNLAAGVGIAAGLGIVEKRRIPVGALVLMLVTIALSRICIEPHSAAAKYRSGVIRVVLVGFFWWRLPSEQKVVGVIFAVALGLIAGVYETAILEREVRVERRRGRWKARAGME